MSDSVVSVIIPVYNAMPWLTECLDSVMRQRLDNGDSLELIAVDDGSSDGSPSVLDAFAKAHHNTRVIHLPHNSGGAGKPCNVGLEMATGDYVFFLGADDYLGDEALARMVAMARRAGSDIVLGKTAPVPGFGTRGHRRIWTRSNEKVDLFNSRVYDSLGQIKLFRRAFLNSLDVSFPEGRRLAADQPLVSYAYLHAEVISLVADYPCYYIRDRGDGSNVTAKPEDPVEFISQVNDMAEVIAAHVSDEARRDRLIERHVRNEVLRWAVGRCWLDDLPDEQRDELVAAACAFLRRWMTKTVFDALPPIYRVMAFCLRNDRMDELTDIVRHLEFGQPKRATVDGGRIYAGLPFFRNPAADIPDGCYDMTDHLRVRSELAELEWNTGGLRVSGHAYIPHVDTDDQTVALVLRERRTGDEHSLTAHGRPSEDLSATVHEGRYDYDYAGFEALIDPCHIAEGGPLPNGSWDVWVEVTAHGVTSRRRLSAPPEADKATKRRYHLMAGCEGAALVAAQFTKQGNLSLRVGSGPVNGNGLVKLIDCHPARTRVLVAAQARLEDWPAGAAAEVCLARGATTKTVPATIERVPGGGLGVTASLPRLRLAMSPGWWGLGVRLSWPEGHWETPVHDGGGKQVWLRGRRTISDLIGRTRGGVRE